MSKNLEQISNVGLEIIEYLSPNKTPDKTWIDETANIIEKSKEPIAQTELMIVEPIEKLFNKLLNN